MQKKDVYLITLETGGNQSYIFSSNKLRDVAGASELIYRVGTYYVKTAIAHAGVKEVKDITQEVENAIEIVVATSGMGVLLANSINTAKKFITEWSKLVVKDSPGVDAIAAYSEKPLDLEKSLDDQDCGYLVVFQDAVRNRGALKSRRANVMSRFQRIPVAAPCAFSNFPAEEFFYERHEKDGKPAARVTKAKIAARDDERFKGRIKDIFHEGKRSAAEGRGLELLEEKEWLGVVHADGNGLGQILTEFGESVKKLIQKEESRAAAGRDYVNLYRKFSRALDEISEETFKNTVDEVWADEKSADIVPIVVGGDDLTAVMDGRKAIPFAKRYMENFCAATEKSDAIAPILRNGTDALKRVGMCAGVCIAKPHFPFSASYKLAEELMQSAKQVKEYGKDEIALDFHILYDSVVTSLDDIRGKLEPDGGVRLTAKPLALPSEKLAASDWGKVHSYGNFERAVRAIAAKGKKRENGEAEAPLLPSSQSHAIREALFAEHVETQEADWAYVIKKYKKFADEWKKVSDGAALYFNAVEPKSGRKCTYFLDALEAADFMGTSGGDKNV